MTGDLEGTATVVANYNQNLKTGIATQWGTFVVATEERTWEGNFHGKFTDTENFGSFEGQGTDGSTDPRRLQLDGRPGVRSGGHHPRTEGVEQARAGFLSGRGQGPEGPIPGPGVAEDPRVVAAEEHDDLMGLVVCHPHPVPLAGRDSRMLLLPDPRPRPRVVQPDTGARVPPNMTISPRAASKAIPTLARPDGRGGRRAMAQVAPSHAHAGGR